MNLFLSFLLGILTLSTLGSAFLLKNSESGQCVNDMDRTVEKTRYSMGLCIAGQATDFKLLPGRESTSQRLASSWTLKEKDKCAFANTDSSAQKNDFVWSAACEGRDACPYVQWTLKQVAKDGGGWQIVHPKDSRCLQELDNVLTVVKTCDPTDPTQVWIQQ